MSVDPYIILTGDTVTNVAEVDIFTMEGSAFVEATGAIDVSSITPQPGMGWTTTDGGKTFTAPVVPIAAPTTESISFGSVLAMSQMLPAQIAQAQADAVTIATIVPGEPLTQGHVDVLVRWGNGWVSLLQGLEALVQSQGVPT